MTTKLSPETEKEMEEFCNQWAAEHGKTYKALIKHELVILISHAVEKAIRGRFGDGFRKGQESVKRKNKSGCCCIIDDSDVIASVCGAHKEWLEKAVAEGIREHIAMMKTPVPND